MNYLILILLLLPALLRGEDFYVGQTASGSGDGSSCPNQLVYSFFNSSGNWGAGVGKISPGDTVHLCGTISGAGANTTALTWQGDGAAGNVITVKFESGAKLSNTNWNGNGAIYGGGSARQYILIDGGTNGLIENTANGSSPTYPNQTDSGGIYFPSCTNCEITNVTVSNLFIKNTTDSQGGGDAIDVHIGSHILVHHNIVHDSRNGLTFAAPGSTSNSDLQVYNNTISRCNQMISFGDTADFALFDTVLIHDNDISDAVNWDDLGANIFHHNGVFIFITQDNSHFTNVRIYNNYIHGDMGARETGHIFLDGEGTGAGGSYGGLLVYNNVLAESGGNSPGNAFVIAYLNGPSGNAPIFSVYNNVFYYPSNVGGRCFMITSVPKVNLQNNIFYNCGSAIYLPSGTGTLVTSNKNSFFGNTDVADDGHLAGPSVTLANWQSQSAAFYGTAFDPNSISVSPNFNTSTFVPNVGSALISAAANLTGLGVTSLDSDKAGTARPSGVTAWDIGANQFVPSGGVTDVQVLDVTPQQIRVAYTSVASGDSCTGTINRHVGGGLARDVDTSLFPGQDTDTNRTLAATRAALSDTDVTDGAVVTGRNRIFIFGRPFDAISPVNGYVYSLSLAESQLYDGTITCPGGAAVAFKATTKSIPVGAGYGRKARVDPRNSYYLWPSNSPAVQEEVIDSMTGALMYQPKSMWLTSIGNSTLSQGGRLGAPVANVGNGKLFERVDCSQAGWADSLGGQSAAQCLSDLTAVDSAFVSTSGTAWAFIGIASAPTVGYAPSGSSDQTQLAFQNVQLTFKCTGAGCSTPAQVELAVSKYGPPVGTEAFLPEPPSRVYGLSATTNTTVVFCKDVPCTTINDPGDHMTNLQVVLFNSPHQSSGTFTGQGTAGVWGLTDNNDCLRMTVGEAVEVFDSGANATATTWFGVIAAKSCGGSPTFTINSWPVGGSNSFNDGGINSPLITGPTAFYYESGLFQGSNSPARFNMRYGFGVRCKNCDGTRSLQINQASWIASSSVTPALNFGSGGMGKRYTMSLSANGYSYGDVNGKIGVGVKTNVDGSLNVFSMGYASIFAQQSDNLIGICGFSNPTGSVIRVTTCVPHGFPNGLSVIVSGTTPAGGQSDMNGGYDSGSTVVDATHIDLQPRQAWGGGGTGCPGTGPAFCGAITFRAGVTNYLGNNSFSSTPWSDTDPRDLYFMTGSSYPAGTIGGKAVAAGRPVLFRFSYTGNDVPATPPNPFVDTAGPYQSRVANQVTTCQNNCTDTTFDFSPYSLVIRNDPNFDASFYTGIAIADISGKYALIRVNSGDQDSMAYFFVLDLTQTGNAMWVGKYDMAKEDASQWCGTHTMQTWQSELGTTIEPDSNKCVHQMNLVSISQPACSKGIGSGTCDPCPATTVAGFTYDPTMHYCSTVRIASTWNTGSWGSAPSGFIPGDPLHSGTVPDPNNTCNTHWLKNIRPGANFMLNYGNVNTEELTKVLQFVSSDSTSQTWIVERAITLTNGTLDFTSGGPFVVTATCSTNGRGINRNDSETALALLYPPSTGGGLLGVPTSTINHATTMVHAPLIPNTATYSGTHMVRLQPKYRMQVGDSSSLPFLKDYTTFTFQDQIHRFGSKWVGNTFGNAVDNHPADNHVSAIPSRREWFFDKLVQLSMAPDAGHLTLVGGSLYDYFFASPDPTSPPQLLQVPSPKHGDIMVYIGQYPMKRVNTLGQAASFDKQFCYAYVANDCFGGSVAAHLYINVVSRDVPHTGCFGGEFFATQAELCLETSNSQTRAVATFLAPPTNSVSYINGQASRMIAKTTAFLQFGDDPTGNVKPVGPDGVWIGDHSAARAWYHSIPVFDTFKRDTFIPIVETERAPSGYTTGAIQFGYSSDFFCSANRDEACIVSSATLDETNPYFYETVDGAQGVNCSSGCSIKIPAISGRIMFYRWRFGTSNFAYGPVKSIAIP